ncbi:MAG: response regulator [Limisphaerales bacterium]
MGDVTRILEVAHQGDPKAANELLPFASKVKILVIDDERAIRNVLEKVLRHAGVEVTTAASGLDGLERARASKPDLITLDVDLQNGMNGFEICAQLKRDPNLSRVPVVFISGRLDEEARHLAFGAGGLDFITKPFPLEGFIERILAHATDRDAAKT